MVDRLTNTQSTDFTKLGSQLGISAALCLLISGLTAADDAIDVKKTTKEQFWATLYKNGGSTFFCKKKFKKKNMLVTEGRIYSESWIRTALDCGTPRQCRKNPRYQKIMTDWHNTIPITLQWKSDNQAVRYEDVEADIKTGSCGEKRILLSVEPPKELKGNIARAIFHMQTKYNLPQAGKLDQFKRWDKLDPPDAEEKQRNSAIKEIIGHENIFISDPEKVNDLKEEDGMSPVLF